MGAAANADGLLGVHTHMTNTLTTPCEALEYAYPLHMMQLPGENVHIHGDEHTLLGMHTTLPSKVTFRAQRGDRIGIASPGGGGYGRREDESAWNFS
jgi:N-methylhydantoinase B